MRTPAIPEELDHGDHDRERDAGDGAKQSDTRETDHRQPELPALDAIDATQIRDFEQADGRGDNDGRKAVFGRYWSRSGASTSSSAMATAPTTPVSCVLAPAASATGVREELLLMGKP